MLRAPPHSAGTASPRRGIRYAVALERCHCLQRSIFLREATRASTTTPSRRCAGLQADAERRAADWNTGCSPSGRLLLLRCALQRQQLRSRLKVASIDFCLATYRLESEVSVRQVPDLYIGTVHLAGFAAASEARGWRPGCLSILQPSIECSPATSACMRLSILPFAAVGLHLLTPS